MLLTPRGANAASIDRERVELYKGFCLRISALDRERCRCGWGAATRKCATPFGSGSAGSAPGLKVCVRFHDEADSDNSQGLGLTHFSTAFALHFIWVPGISVYTFVVVIITHLSHFSRSEAVRWASLRYMLNDGSI